jgi:apolipoprotein N-acyltransferase
MANPADPNPAQTIRHDEASPAGSWIPLFAAGLLFIFADGRYTVALAAWLAPMCLLRFLRERRSGWALAAAYAVLVAARAFAQRGMAPIPGAAYFAFAAVMGAIGLLPYLLDRWIAGRRPGFSWTLVFPAARVALEFFRSFRLHGSWGSDAYTQAGNLPLLQLLSVTGLWGITFLMGWFASTATWVWALGWSSKRSRRGAGIFIAVYGAGILLGGARLAIFPPAAPTVRVASMSGARDGPGLSGSVSWDVIRNHATQAELGEFAASTEATAAGLLARAEREAQAGARIVFWSEGNVLLLKADEFALIARGSRLAATYRIYLGMGLIAVQPGEPKPFENKFVLIGPEGQVAWNYLKTRLTPGPEAAMTIAGKGRLPLIETPFGKLSGAICFDADFPRLLAQAGSAGADLMLVPAHDWLEIDPQHTEMAGFRAIEQGFNLVRQTGDGRSAAFDYEGRLLASEDDFAARDNTLVAQVPTRGVSTLYSRWGDWFAWVCVAGLAASGLLAAAQRKFGAGRSAS